MNNNNISKIKYYIKNKESRKIKSTQPLGFWLQSILSVKCDFVYLNGDMCFNCVNLLPCLVYNIFKMCKMLYCIENVSSFAKMVNEFCYMLLPR